MAARSGEKGEGRDRWQRRRVHAPGDAYHYRNIIKTEPYDNAYGLPLIYCHFTCKRHLPYESIEIYEQTQGGFEHLENVRLRNRLTLREVREIPGRLRGEFAQRRFEKDIAEQKLQFPRGN